MKAPITLFFLIACLLAQAQNSTQNAVAQLSTRKTVEPVAKSINNTTKADSSLLYNDTIIKWMTIEQAIEAQKKNSKKIFVHVYVTWCRWCKMEDSLPFRNREIAHYINQHYYAVKFNAEMRAPVMFKGTRYVFNGDENKFVHDFARYLLNGRASYPGTVILDEQANLLNAKNGYMDPLYLETVLNYYASNAYKKINYYDYAFDFEGKIDE